MCFTTSDHHFKAIIVHKISWYINFQIMYTQCT